MTAEGSRSLAASDAALTAETEFGAHARREPGLKQLDDWIAIERDGTITAYSGKVELGTGVRTALTQIVAEELDVAVEQVRLVMGDTGRTPDEGYTAGSKTIMVSGAALRTAAAEARQALLEQAAARLGAKMEALVVEQGMVWRADAPERRVSYAELMGGRRFERAIRGTAPLKRPERYTVSGAATQRLDLPAKFLGQASFVQDLRLPGMLHGRVVRPPSAGATLLTLDAGDSGDARVVRIGSFVGVVAEREEQAIRAARNLRMTWRETAALPAMGDVAQALRAQAARDQREQVVAQSGDVARGLASASTRIRATYFQPFQAHASIGPSCAVATMMDDMLLVWCSSQGVFGLRGALADLLEMPVERIRVIHVEGAGCYGHAGADDAAADAAVLARAVGRPVRVQWSREDEFIWEPKSPATVVEVEGGLAEDGAITAWDYQAWSPSHSRRPRQAAELIAGQLTRETPLPPSVAFMGGDRNAKTEYTLPNSRVTLRWLTAMPIRSSSMRSLGATVNTFANESFMDELAAAAGADPLAFRLRRLDDPRARDTLNAAAERAGWGEQMPHGTGRGLAFARYENREAYVATVAEVVVQPETGALRVTRVVVAHDCGLIINPDGVRNQIEGNVIQSLSRALKEEVTFDERQITSTDWATYPILTFFEIPEIEIVLLNRPDQQAVGAGEPATITTAASVANAIYDAVGVRVREQPFTAARVLRALREQR